MPYPIDIDVEFFAKIAHEIRQPLSPMRSALQLMKKCEDTQVREHAYRTIERQIDHMTHLLDDLISAAALGRTALEVRRARFDLREVVDEAVETVKPIATQYGQRLDVSLPTNAVWIDADPLRLRQVVSNLLSNAFKHTRAGERVWVRIHQDRAGVLLVVADNGRGIPNGSLRRIFDPFTQAEHTASGFGFGLGLAIVKQLVELQGGTVEAFSAGLERGSRFVVSLPPPMVANHVITSAARLLPQSQSKHAPTHRSLTNHSCGSFERSSHNHEGHESHEAHDTSRTSPRDLRDIRVRRGYGPNDGDGVEQ